MVRAAFYKGTHAGLPGVYNRLVRWWTRSQYSHVELVFSSGRAASASYMDKGVRFKLIEFGPAKWDFIDLPDELELQAYDWFTRHRGKKYDLLGNVHFVLSAVGHDKRRWFCSEAVGAALGIPEPHRYDPGTLASALTIYNRPAPAGFFTPTESPM